MRRKWKFRRSNWKRPSTLLKMPTASMKRSDPGAQSLSNLPHPPRSGPGVGDRSSAHTLAFFSETINSTSLAEMVVLRSHQRVPLSAEHGSYWILPGGLGFIMKPLSSTGKDQSSPSAPPLPGKDQNKRSWPGGGSVNSCVCGRSLSCCYYACSSWNACPAWSCPGSLETWIVYSLGWLITEDVFSLSSSLLKTA